MWWNCSNVVWTYPSSNSSGLVVSRDDFIIFCSDWLNPCRWMGSNVQGIVSAFHITRHCASSVVTLLRDVLRHQELKKYKIELIPVMQNLVDVIWPVRPKPAPKKLIVLDTFYSGKYQLSYPQLLCAKISTSMGKSHINLETQNK